MRLNPISPRLPILFVLALLCALGSSPGQVSADPPGAVEEANEALVSASRAGRQMLELLDQSRRSRNVRETSCVDGALSQINSFRRDLEQRRDRLVTARARADRMQAAHHQLVIRAIVRQLRARERAGRACVYGEMPREGNVTTVTVLIDRDVPQYDDLSPGSADLPRRR